VAVSPSSAESKSCSESQAWGPVAPLCVLGPFCPSPGILSFPCCYEYIFFFLPWTSPVYSCVLLPLPCFFHILSLSWSPLLFFSFPVACPDLCLSLLSPQFLWPVPWRSFRLCACMCRSVSLPSCSFSLLPSLSVPSSFFLSLLCAASWHFLLFLCFLAPCCFSWPPPVLGLFVQI